MTWHRLIFLLAGMLALVITGCPEGSDDDDTVATDIEGNEPGECGDGADNDSDGLFDCDDPDCAGAPDCQGDDDDATGDDDDSVDDDDATTDDDDATTDDDDATTDDDDATTDDDDATTDDDDDATSDDDDDATSNDDDSADDDDDDDAVDDDDDDATTDDDDATTDDDDATTDDDDATTDDDDATTDDDDATADDDDATADDDDAVDDDDDDATTDDDDAVSNAIAPVVSLPSSPTTTSDLVLSLQVPGFDENGLPYTSYEIDWTRNSLAQAAYDDSWSVPASATTRDELWIATVTPTAGGPAGVAQTTILNTAPVISSIQLTPPNPTEGGQTDAVAQGAFDADNDPVSIDCIWHINGAPIPGAGTFLTGAHYDKGETITCMGTPTDGTSDGVAILSSPALAANTAPSLTFASVDPPTGDPTTIFTCISSGWSDPDPADSEDSSIQWYEDGVPTSTNTSINAVPAGTFIHCTATPDDGDDLGAPVTSAQVEVQSAPGNSAPSITSAEITPTDPTSTQDLDIQLNGWFDVDGDPEGFTVIWSIGGNPSLITSTTFPSSATTKDDFVEALVTPFDGDLSGTPYATTGITIGNAAPAVASVTINFDASSGIFTSSPTGITDPDNDTVSLSYIWELNGLPTGNTSSVYAPGPLPAGSQVVVVVTPFDGEDIGDPVESSALVVEPDASLSETAFDLGTRQIGCEIITTVTLNNDGVADLEFDAALLVDLNGTGEFTVLSAPTSGTVVGPQTSIDIEVLFTGIDLDPAAARLDVVTDDPDSPTLSVDFDAEAELGGYRTVETIIGEGSDILFVVDQSCSMTNAQDQVADHVSDFLDALGTNFNIGVVDMDSNALTAPIITAATLDPATDLASAIDIGALGALEDGFDTALLAIDEPLISAANAGLLRPGVQLRIIFVTDEPEQSITSPLPADFLAAAELLVPAGVSASLIGGGPTACSTGPTAPYVLTSSAQPDYVTAYTDSAGVLVNVCADSLTTDMMALGDWANSGSDGDLVYLTFPAVDFTVEVTVNGVVTTVGWTFDPLLNAVEFNPPLLDGDVVEIDYREAGGYCGDNRSPVGNLQLVASGGTCDLVTLDASATADADNDPLTFDWSFGSVPPTSLLTDSDLTELTADVVYFTPDVDGDYDINLLVSDPSGSTSEPLSEVVAVTPLNTPGNLPPFADAGPASLALLTEVPCTTGPYGNVCGVCAPLDQLLDGSASFDVETDIARYQWELLVSSGETLSNELGATTNLEFPSVPYTDSVNDAYAGAATVQLTVLDCDGVAATTTVDVSWECIWIP